jgi:hypothetical protein
LIRDGSDLLWLAVAFFMRGGSSSSAPSSAPGSSSNTGPELGPALERPLQRTGEDDPIAWARRRFALIMAVLHTLEPPIPADKLRDIALSLLAQWAHETARGRSEFNFNLGGWTARKDDPFHVAKDVLTSKTTPVRWTAYPDLGTAIEDQIRRLTRFKTAWGMLVDEPVSSAWVEQLGRSGYYSARPADYARAWAMHRAELAGVLP